jgi:hypothetical protein
MSPLANAMYFDNFDAVNLLLEHGADPHVEANGRQNSFHQLIKNDHSELLEAIYPLAVRYQMQRRWKKYAGTFGLFHFAATIPNS